VTAYWPEEWSNLVRNAFTDPDTSIKSVRVIYIGPDGQETGEKQDIGIQVRASINDWGFANRQTQVIGRTSSAPETQQKVAG